MYRIIETINEGIIGDTMRFYHGTSIRNLKGIIKKGIIDGYISPMKDGAKAYAIQSWEYGEDGILVVLDIPMKALRIILEYQIEDIKTEWEFQILEPIDKRYIIRIDKFMNKS